jgi:hypothetical protein
LLGGSPSKWSIFGGPTQVVGSLLPSLGITLPIPCTRAYYTKPHLKVLKITSTDNIKQFTTVTYYKKRLVSRI